MQGSRSDATTSPIRQNEFGEKLITALAAHAVTDIRRDDRLTLDAAFRAAYRTVGAAIGFNALSTFKNILDLRDTSKVAESIIQFSWTLTHVYIPPDDQRVIHIMDNLTPEIALARLEAGTHADIWLRAAHAFIAEVKTWPETPRETV